MKKKMIFLLQYIISIILLLLDDHYIYIIISILCWCFCIVYNILQKKCTYTLWSLEYLRLSVIGIDGCTVGMYHTHSLSLPSTDRHRWVYCWDVPQSTLYLRLIGIDGGTVGMYHSPLSTFTCNKHIKEIDCELLIKGTFLHFAFHLLCPR